MQCDREQREQCPYHRELCDAQGIILAAFNLVEDTEEFKEKVMAYWRKWLPEPKKGDDS